MAVSLVAQLRDGVYLSGTNDEISIEMESKSVEIIVENLMKEIMCASSGNKPTNASASGLVSFAFKLDAATEWMGRVVNACAKHGAVTNSDAVKKLPQSSKSPGQTGTLLKMCHDVQFWKTTCDILRLRALGCQRSIHVAGQLFVASALPTRLGEAVLKSVISVFGHSIREAQTTRRHGQLIAALTETIAALMFQASAHPKNTSKMPTIASQAAGILSHIMIIACFHK